MSYKGRVTSWLVNGRVIQSERTSSWSRCVRTMEEEDEDKLVLPRPLGVRNLPLWHMWRRQDGNQAGEDVPACHFNGQAGATAIQLLL
jgi:hypothetical protein